VALNGAILGWVGGVQYVLSLCFVPPMNHLIYLPLWPYTSIYLPKNLPKPLPIGLRDRYLCLRNRIGDDVSKYAGKYFHVLSGLSIHRYLSFLPDSNPSVYLVPSRRV
jgi:hypothetical protein